MKVKNKLFLMQTGNKVESEGFTLRGRLPGVSGWFLFSNLFLSTFRVASITLQRPDGFIGRQWVIRLWIPRVKCSRLAHREIQENFPVKICWIWLWKFFTYKFLFGKKENIRMWTNYRNQISYLIYSLFVISTSCSFT